MITQDRAIQQARHEANQQREFEDLIPFVEDVLDNHSDLLSDQEEAWVHQYLIFISYRNTCIPNTIADEAEKIICSIHNL